MGGENWLFGQTPFTAIESIITIGYTDHACSIAKLP